MADRFPLILNTSTNQIQELPSGDSLDLTGNGLNISGITTLTTSAQLNLGGGTNINSGTRGDILYYDSNGRIAKLNLGTEGQVLKSNGTDLVYGASASVANVFYVSTTGTDASGFGSSVDSAFKTIKYACSNIGTPTSANPAIIFVKAGTYEETSLPIVVPPNTTIAGDSLRATIIKPKAGLDSGGSIQNNRSTMFRMSDATVLQDLVMDGMGGYTPGIPAYKPESATIGGTYLALNAASPILTKSPYIYNVTSFGNGATGAVLDGSLHSTGNRSMLFHTYTAVHSDGLGLFLKNNANAEMISTFSYFCQVGYACIGGSKIRSLNSSNAYGEYGVYSAGFDAGESPNQGTVRGNMLTYVGVLSQSFQDGEQITGGTSNATAYVVNVQSEPKRMYVVQKSGTFQANETVTGGTSGATATMAAASVETNQSGRILVTQFSTSADAGDALQFATTDGNAYQIQSVSSVTANSVAYHVLVFSTSRPTPVASGVTVNVRKEFSLIRLTGHDFLQVGTGGTDTTNWPNNPTQNPNQDYQITTNSTDPGRVYYTATDDLGNFYVGDQFKVDQATGNVTLDASAFNLSGLESLRLGSVGGLIGASINEFSTDATMSQNSDTKVSTQKAVKTYVDTLDGITPVGGTFTLAGISTVTGNTFFTKQLNVSGVSTFHNNVDLLDGDRLRFGDSQDLQIYHDVNNSIIAENGAGNLILQASTGNIQFNKSNGHNMIVATTGGGVELYENNTKRIETTSTGGKVTGNLEVTGVLTYEDVTNVDSVGIITARQGVRLGVDGTSSTNYISVGAGNDLKIWHQSSNNHSYISETGSGSLIVLADDFYVQDTSTATMISAKEGAEVNLHFNGGSPKLSTTNTGITVTGGGVFSSAITASTYIQGTSSNGGLKFYSDSSASKGVVLNTDDHLVPTHDSNSDLGLTGTRWRNVYADTLYGDGSNITALNASNLASGTVPIARLGASGTKSGSTFLAGDNTFKTVTVAINSIANDADNRVITSDGDGTATAESNLQFDGTNLSLGIAPGQHYYDRGIAVHTGGTGAVLHLTDSTSGSGQTNGFDIISHAGNAYLWQRETPDMIIGIGGQTKWTINNDGDILPHNNGTQDIGSSGKRVQNFYTSDLHLSNEAKGGNSIDNTWGDYTIQEGESDLFLINNRNGKKYKFNLTEVN